MKLIGRRGVAVPRAGVSPLRVIAVTGGLVLTGAVVGAFCGALALSIVLMLYGDAHLVWNSLLGAAFGAPTGAILAPLFTWGLLRHVPLGRAISHSAIGAVLGGVLGFGLGLLVLQLWYGPLVGAILGFLTAAIRLRVITSKTSGSVG